MTKEELEKNYYANRPIEPYSSDDCPNDWANIAYYAEENLERAFKRIVELECECRRCVYTDCPCILSDYGKDRNGICDHFKDVFDKNAELEEKVSYLEDNFAESREKRIEQLEAQIEKMKCCYNCKHTRTEYEHCKTDKHEKWEIKENEKISG